VIDTSSLQDLAQRGWRLTRDGSTATAFLPWDDLSDPDSGWELLVLHTAGHGARFTLNVHGSGLTERSPEEARGLADALSDALMLLEFWTGELPEGEED
jgi:hypothetical protein